MNQLSVLIAHPEQKVATAIADEVRQSGHSATKVYDGKDVLRAFEQKTLMR
ncbi:MAG: hypothetical protein IPJ88_15930 [Myxococcales bacterium]|nr:MAG: hypothetical protein IPJ88_15930 [Myxococcales bacterium]